MTSRSFCAAQSFSHGALFLCGSSDAHSAGVYRKSEISVVLSFFSGLELRLVGLEAGQVCSISTSGIKTSKFTCRTLIAFRITGSLEIGVIGYDCCYSCCLLLRLLFAHSMAA